MNIRIKRSQSDEIGLFSDDHNGGGISYLTDDRTGLSYYRYSRAPIIYYEAEKLSAYCYIIEDPELLQFSATFHKLRSCMISFNNEEAELIIESLKPFDVLLDRKVGYATDKEDLKCGGCDNEYCKSIEFYDTVINVHYEGEKSEIEDVVTSRIKQHICKPYPPKIKSARNF